MSRNQNFKSYGRGKHSNHPNTVVHSSIQFDKFFCENSNKPTAAKSAGTVGKWGITSFTSIRSSTFSLGHPKETSRFSSLGKKRSQPVPDNGMQIKRAVLNNNAKRECSPILTNRKFFKSRNTLDDSNQKSYKSSNASETKKSGKHSRTVNENKKQKNCIYEENKPKSVPVVRNFEKPIKISTKKIPTLKVSENSISVSEGLHNLENMPSPPKERDKPPIVLRIFKGTSQLISETGSKSDLDEGLRENVEIDSHLEDNHLNSQISEPVPKRILRSTKNMMPPGKIVITNLNSDHPSVYINDVSSSPVPSLTSPSRKEVKEHDTKTVVDDRLTIVTETNSNSDTEIKNESTVGSVISLPPTTTNKKGSIFKHRSSNDGNKKRLALYKHKWVDEKDGANNPDEEKSSQTTLSKTQALDSILDADVDDMPLTKFIRQPSENTFDFDEPVPITGVKCSKKNKDFYTVVRNVKKAHQIQESGEFQEFNDDVEYILDALQDNNPVGTRCLSAITLATKCTEPAFRMHVRAHGTVTKFFRTLHDATKDQSLGLCTATVMFVLSQDRLNMDLDRDSLELMLNLLESDASHTKALEDCGLTDLQLTKTRDRVRQICADIQGQGHAKHLNLDNITVGHLSMETLLSLTSKRAGEWFKEELRELGGLEHIIKTVVECCKHVDDTANAWSTTSLEKIRKVDRCLRVLENVTMQNEQNNDYLLDYQSGILIDTLVRMYKVCDYEIPLYPTYSINDKESTGAILRECLIANLKVLINITHDYQSKSNGSNVIGSRPGVIESSLHVLLQVPQYIPKEEKFDLMLLTLILLINLVEHCDLNRKTIIEAKAPSDEESIFETKAREPAVKALISMFYNYEELARNEEKKTDAILEGENAEKPPTNAPQKAHEDFIEETISQLVQKAGQNMEHTLIAAYVAMLIGYLIIDNEEYEKFVRNYLPEKNFHFMISVLQKFYSFMTLTASGGTVSNRGMKSIQMVIQKLIDSDRRYGFDFQAIQNSDTCLLRNENDNDTKNTDTTQCTVYESQNTSEKPVSDS